MVKVREDLPLLGTSLPTMQITSQQQSNTPLSAQHVDQEAWLARIVEKNAGEPLPKLQEACVYVRGLVTQQEGLNRSDAYITGLGTADIVAHFAVQDELLAAAVLFRSLRENLVHLTEIRKSFGEEIASLVAGVAAMGGLSDLIEQNRRLGDQSELFIQDQQNSIYKMLISVTEDVRVVLIKLAERTFALRELSHAHPERQKRVAHEILSIYAPLAHRLGIAQIKWELEDLAFRFIAPERYKEIARLLSEKRVERERYIALMKEKLGLALEEKVIDAEVTGRVKHIYSIYKKMRNKKLSFDQLYDIRAIRVLVHSIDDCYRALGAVHQLWHPIHHQFDDYIANPKSNGYRSIHTAVLAESKSMEVQIRTFDMHFEAELGVCAHFNYKEGATAQDLRFNHKLLSLRHILETYQGRGGEGSESDTDAPFGALEEWSESERIFVFTRDGEIKELAKDATVLDFAYHIHTEVGNQCYAARVNQRAVPLNFKLKTGHQIEIFTHPEHEPSRDWLIPSLGFINTAGARDKLRHWFRQQAKSKNLDMGRSLLNAALERLAIHPNSIDLNDFIAHFDVRSSDELLVGLITGEASLNQLIERIQIKLNEEARTTTKRYRPVIDKVASPTLERFGLLVNGIEQVVLQHAGCCTPHHEQPIEGYINDSNIVLVHQLTCPVYRKLMQLYPEKHVEVSWQLAEYGGQVVNIVIEAFDRRGLLRDVTDVVFSDQVNITRVNTVSESNGTASLTLEIEVTGLVQLSRLLARLEQLAGVTSARRLL